MENDKYFAPFAIYHTEKSVKNTSAKTNFAKPLGAIPYGGFTC